MLIEKTLLHLDLDEINLLYPFKKIKQVWLDYLIPQEEYLYTLNRFSNFYCLYNLNFPPLHKDCARNPH